MRTLERNKMIAIFMDYQVYPDDHCDTEPENNNAINSVKHLEFMFNSWNELMPVVEQCLRTGDNTDAWDEMFDALMTVDINTVYESVVEFIKEQ